MLAPLLYMICTIVKSIVKFVSIFDNKLLKLHKKQFISKNNLEKEAIRLNGSNYFYK